MIEDLLSQLEIDVISCEPFHWKRVQTTPAYIVQGPDFKYFLKVIDTPIKRNQKYVRWFTGNLAIKNQLRVYASLCKQQFFFFKYPKLIKTDGNSYLLLEYISSLKKREQVLPEDMLVLCLIEFQLSDVTLKRNYFESFLMNLSRKPFWVLLRRSLGGVRKTCGLSVSLNLIKVFLICYLQQSRLLKKITTHGDFHPNNLLMNNEGEIYIFDFEKVTKEKYWLFIDIVHYAVSTKKFFIEVPLIKIFIEKLRFKFEKIGLLNIRAQLRFALLLRVSQIILSSVSPVDVRERYKVFLRDVLLNDVAFHQWIEKSRF
jgi:hypothetical protein